MVSTQDNYWTGSSPVLCSIFFLTICLKINISLSVQGEKKKSLFFKKLASSIDLSHEVCYIPWWREMYLQPMMLQLKHERPGLKLRRHPWPQKRQLRAERRWRDLPPTLFAEMVPTLQAASQRAEASSVRIEDDLPCLGLWVNTRFNWEKHHFEQPGGDACRDETWSGSEIGSQFFSIHHLMSQ